MKKNKIPDLKMETYKGRSVVFTALFGSHNYHLNDENSDFDYKVFVLPTFDDLYKGKRFSSSETSNECDFDVHDVRELPKLLFKTNINFLEVLFSRSYYINPNYEDFVTRLLANRENIAAINLRYFYNACKGMSHNKIKNLHKYSERNKYLANRDGYNTKEACHAFRVLDTFIRYYYTNFTDFYGALSYFSNDEDCQGRWLLKEIKYGMIPENVFMLQYQKLYEKFNSIANRFMREPDINLYECLQNAIEDICLCEIRDHVYDISDNGL